MIVPEPRPAAPADADRLAAIHVSAWAETYPGLLPEDEIARHGLAFRRRQWASALARGATRIAVAGDLGLAEMGPQRSTVRQREWPEELYALYVLRSAHGTGLGRALLDAVASDLPFTAEVLDGNARAMAFYRKTGAIVLGREPLGAGIPDHILIGWRSPPV